MQFLGRKKPIFGDFWTFLIIFGFELMPASASLCCVKILNDSKSAIQVMSTVLVHAQIIQSQLYKLNTLEVGYPTHKMLI